MKIEELSKKTKICIHCKIQKFEEEFYKRKDAISNICTLCNRKYHSIHKKQLIKTRVVKMVGDKICKDCHNTKPITQFPIERNYADGRDCRCHSCWHKKRNGYVNGWITKRVGYTNHNATPSRKKNLVGKITAAQVLEKIKLQDYKCIYCAITLTDKNLALDHRTPICRKGVNMIENIDCVCIDCNMLKFKRTQIEFKTFILEYAKRILSSQLEPKA
jgi:5-methylcytosine-specific restriction endonuclease McrA